MDIAPWEACVVALDGGEQCPEFRGKGRGGLYCERHALDRSRRDWSGTRPKGAEPLGVKPTSFALGEKHVEVIERWGRERGLAGSRSAMLRDLLEMLGAT